MADPPTKKIAGAGNGAMHDGVNLAEPPKQQRAKAEAARGSEEGLRRILADPNVGRTISASMDAIQAICHHHGSKADINPFIISALELLNRAAHMARFLDEVRPETQHDEKRAVVRNDFGRATSAALLILLGKATMGLRKIVIDQGAIWDQIATRLEKAGGPDFERATEGVQKRVVDKTITYVISLTGLRPSRETTRRALLVARQKGPPKMAVRTSRRDDVTRAPSKYAVFCELMGELGVVPGRGKFGALKPNSSGSLMQARLRQRRLVK